MTSYFSFLFIEGVGAEHLSDGFKRSSKRKHELLKLVLILSCQNTAYNYRCLEVLTNCSCSLVKKTAYNRMEHNAMIL